MLESEMLAIWSAVASGLFGIVALWVGERGIFLFGGIMMVMFLLLAARWSEEETGTGSRRKDVVCPVCESQGFDGRGPVIVEGTEMYLRGCWECGTEFAVEVARERDADE